MVEGTLTINLEPPYLTFDSTASGIAIRRECSLKDIGQLLLTLGASTDFKWPLRDCLIRVQGSFKKEVLLQFQLIPACLPTFPRIARKGFPGRKNGCAQTKEETPMGIYIGMFEFEGPGLRLEELLPKPGVFAILQHDQITDEYSLVEVGHVESLTDWARSVAFKAIRRQVVGEVLLAVYYTDISETGRASIVAAIEQEFAHEPRIDLQSFEAV